MDYYDLGSYTRKVTTAVPDAQLWFDRGLNWLYGFNHAEAIEAARMPDPARRDALIEQRLDLALARSEVPVKASCFCRMKVAA